MRRGGTDGVAARGVCAGIRARQTLAPAGLDPEIGRGLSPLGHAGGVHRQPAGRPVQAGRYRRRASGRRPAQPGLPDAAQHDAAHPLRFRPLLGSDPAATGHGDRQ